MANCGVYTGGVWHCGSTEGEKCLDLLTGITVTSYPQQLGHYRSHPSKDLRPACLTAQGFSLRYRHPRPHGRHHWSDTDDTGSCQKDLVILCNFFRLAGNLLVGLTARAWPLIGWRNHRHAYFKNRHWYSPTADWFTSLVAGIDRDFHKNITLVSIH